MSDYKLLSLSPAEPGWRALYADTDDLDGQPWIAVEPLIGWGLFELCEEGEEDDTWREVHGLAVFDDDWGNARRATENDSFHTYLRPGDDVPGLTDEGVQQHIRDQNTLRKSVAAERKAEAERRTLLLQTVADLGGSAVSLAQITQQSGVDRQEAVSCLDTIRHLKKDYRGQYSVRLCEPRCAQCASLLRVEAPA